MSTEIRQSIGYGLTGLAVDQAGKLADPRVNTASWLLSGEEVPSRTEYRVWLDSRYGRRPRREWSLDYRIIAGHDQDPHCPARLGECAVYQGEPSLGLPGVLVLQPYSQAGWTRCSDPVDAAAEAIRSAAARSDSRDPRAEPVPGPLWPYLSWMDATTGERVDDPLVISWASARRAARNGDSRPAGGVLDAYARELGYDSHAHAAWQVVPEVPRDIRDLAEYAGLFTCPGTWIQLRPVLYTWWG